MNKKAIPPEQMPHIPADTGQFIAGLNNNNDRHMFFIDF
jgi:hypothetical protein